MLNFTKMHGLGNDYIYVDCTRETVANPAALARRVSDRHFGVGSDGLVLIKPSALADFRMEMFNADGSEGEMCGNALRCVGKYVYERGLSRKTELDIETLAGIKSLSLKLEHGKVSELTADMGAPGFNSRLPQLTLASELEEYIDLPTKIGGQTLNLTVVCVGSPHAVTFVEDAESLDLHALGPLIENHALFPKRINCEFVQVIDKNTLKLRVWERGSGETMACGTGTCASAAAGIILGKIEPGDVSVQLRGGALKIKWPGVGHNIYMTGSAEFVYDGVLPD